MKRKLDRPTPIVNIKARKSKQADKQQHSEMKPISLQNRTSGGQRIRKLNESDPSPPRWRKIVLICSAYTFLFIGLLYVLESTPVQPYIAAVKNERSQNDPSAKPTATKPSEERGESERETKEHENELESEHVHQMRLEIEDIASKLNQPPVNAKNDSIWKAIPGYNGLEVNVEKSLQLAKAIGKVQPERLVFDEIEPEVMLEDLLPQPIYRGNMEKPMVGLMINVAWGSEYLEDMLNVLDDYQVRASFFLDGGWLKNNTELAREILDRGHEIGNHAYSHPDLRTMSIAEINDEIKKPEALIRELGTRSYLFAPPAGAFDDRVVKVAHQQNMKTVLWTLDTVDWKKPPASTIKERIIPHLENGALILMHPTEPTVKALPDIIEGAFEQELMVGTASEVISPARAVSVVRLD
jgi:peptidoglycan-N-acetylglucosamine deacetylase